MGCTASTDNGGAWFGENRPRELDKCRAVSSEVRWPWLRDHTRFTFCELRSLLKIYQTATMLNDNSHTFVGAGHKRRQLITTPPDRDETFVRRTSTTAKSPAAGGFGGARGGSTVVHEAPISTASDARAPSSLCSTLVASSQSSSSSRTSREGSDGMDKAQFLAACRADEGFRLPEVVGGFGSRLFDVLDESGRGTLSFEEFTLGMSKLLRVRVP